MYCSFESSNDQVNQALVEFHHNLTHLNKECLDINVSAQSIRNCIVTHGTATAYDTVSYGGMTPLHFLALNYHADEGAIIVCLEANMGAVLEKYSEGDRLLPTSSPNSGKTLLEYLAEYDMGSHLSVIAALCEHREAHLSERSE